MLPTFLHSQTYRYQLKILLLFYLQVDYTPRAQAPFSVQVSVANDLTLIARRSGENPAVQPRSPQLQILTRSLTLSKFYLPPFYRSIDLFSQKPNLHHSHSNLLISLASSFPLLSFPLLFLPIKYLSLPYSLQNLLILFFFPPLASFPSSFLLVPFRFTQIAIIATSSISLHDDLPPIPTYHTTHTKIHAPYARVNERRKQTRPPQTDLEHNPVFTLDQSTYLRVTMILL